MRKDRMLLCRVGWLWILVLLVSMYPEPRARPETARGGVLKRIEANMVRIPGGRYMMWPTPYKTEEPGHWVEVEPFLIGRYEVTQREYQAVMGKNPSHFRGDPDLPVEQVSWHDCQEFIRRLNRLEGEEVFRLPTEAEWEYICLAGSGNDYGFCDEEDGLSQYAWYKENSRGRTHPVGELKQNPWGLYDVHGNVWEWCQDWHGDYPPGALTTAEGRSRVSFRVLRGGGYDSPTGDCRSHSRRSYSPAGTRRRNVGFRLARAISPKLLFEKAAGDHPYLGRMVDEEGFNGLSHEAQRELIGMIDRYAFLLDQAEYYKQESNATSMAYFRRAKSLKRRIEARFGGIMKE
ncbi:MAG: formylglycine-generating enzyme family protein [Deltaproteobacteria bacterium]|nr:formylglycine-generating enzyme family protein [Deltaproteobacteria bacterium]